MLNSNVFHLRLPGKMVFLHVMRVLAAARFGQKKPKLCTKQPYGVARATEHRMQRIPRRPFGARSSALRVHTVFLLQRLIKVLQLIFEPPPPTIKCFVTRTNAGFKESFGAFPLYSHSKACHYNYPPKSPEIPCYSATEVAFMGKTCLARGSSSIRTMIKNNIL